LVYIQKKTHVIFSKCSFFGFEVDSIGSSCVFEDI